MCKSYYVWEWSNRPCAYTSEWDNRNRSVFLRKEISCEKDGEIYRLELPPWISIPLLPNTHVRVLRSTDQGSIVLYDDGGVFFVRGFLFFLVFISIVASIATFVWFFRKKKKLEQ